MKKQFLFGKKRDATLFLDFLFCAPVVAYGTFKENKLKHLRI